MAKKPFTPKTIRISKKKEIRLIEVFRTISNKETQKHLLKVAEDLATMTSKK